MKVKHMNKAQHQKAPLTGKARQRDIVLRQFRAHLHLAVTAGQTGRQTEFASLPGPNSLTYCQALAKLPGHTLTIEMGQPVRALLAQIDAVSAACEDRLASPDPAKSVVAQKVLDDLDQALANILSDLTIFVKHRAAVTTCPELLSEVYYGWLFDEGGQMAGSLRRYSQMRFEEGREPDGSIASGSLPDDFARDVFARVVTLERLLDVFPDHLRAAAQFLPAWPVLAYRHADRRPRLVELLERLDLGAASFIDTHPSATFDPDAPLVKYLLPLIERLEGMCAEMGDRTYRTVEIEQKMLLHLWWRWPEQPPAEPVLAPLRAARQLPELTRATADQWAREVFVPLIMATDARDPLNVTHPDLQAFARDISPSSADAFATFLLSAICDTLSQLLRPPNTAD
jgi:hypothetical protein